MIRRGEDWGSAAGGPPDRSVAGSDADLAAAVAEAPGALVSFVAGEGSDVARVVGLAPGKPPVTGREAPMDVLSLPGGGVAVNAVVLGVAPDRARPWHRRAAVTVEVDGRAETARATGVVILTGQYLRGADVSPRSHPGDGVAEVQTYGLAPAQRRAMRRRLAAGAHLPHPDIGVRRGRRVTVRTGRPWPVEVDGRPAGRAAVFEVTLVAGAYRLLI